MNNEPAYRLILSATDFSTVSFAAVQAASDLVRALGASRLHVVHVRRPSDVLGVPPMALGVSPELITRLDAEALADAQTRLDNVELVSLTAEVTREVRSGGAAEEIVRAAREQGADLLVLASHGRTGLGRVVFGSVTSNVLRHAPCPVYVVGEQRHASAHFQRVLAAVDLSEASTAVLRHASAFAGRAGAALEVVSFVDRAFPYDGGMLGPVAEGLVPTADEHRALVERTVARAELPGSVDVRVFVDRMSPATGILERARATRADLVVVGTSGHNVFERAMLGSTASGVAARAEVPVLVVPRAG